MRQITDVEAYSKSQEAYQSQLRKLIRQRKDEGFEEADIREIIGARDRQRQENKRNGERGLMVGRRYVVKIDVEASEDGVAALVDQFMSNYTAEQLESLTRRIRGDLRDRWVEPTPDDHDTVAMDAMPQAEDYKRSAQDIHSILGSAYAEDLTAKLAGAVQAESEARLELGGTPDVRAFLKSHGR